MRISYGGCEALSADTYKDIIWGILVVYSREGYNIGLQAREEPYGRYDALLAAQNWSHIGKPAIHGGTGQLLTYGMPTSKL